MKKKFYYGDQYIEPVSKEFSVVVNTENCKASEYPTSVDPGDTFTVVFTANYAITDESDFIVTLAGNNLTSSYDSTTKRLSITCTNATSNIRITVKTKAVYGVTFNYVYIDGDIHRTLAVESMLLNQDTGYNYNKTLSIPTTVDRYSTYGIISYDITGDLETLYFELTNESSVEPTSVHIYDNLIVRLTGIEGSIIINVYIDGKYAELIYNYDATIITEINDNFIHDTETDKIYCQYNKTYNIESHAIIGYKFIKYVRIYGNAVYVRDTENPISISVILQLYYDEIIIEISYQRAMSDWNYHSYLFDVTCPRISKQVPIQYYGGTSLLYITPQSEYTSKLYEWINPEIFDPEIYLDKWFIPVSYGRRITDLYESPYSTLPILNLSGIKTDSPNSFDLMNPIICSAPYDIDSFDSGINVTITKHPITHYLIPTSADNLNYSKFICYWATNRYVHNEHTAFGGEDPFEDALYYDYPYGTGSNSAYVVLKPYFIYAPGYINPNYIFDENILDIKDNEYWYTNITNFGITTNDIDMDTDSYDIARSSDGTTNYRFIYTYPSINPIEKYTTSYLPAFIVNLPDEHIGDYIYDTNIAGAVLYNGDHALFDIDGKGVYNVTDLYPYIIDGNEITNKIAPSNAKFHLHVETDDISYPQLYSSHWYITYLKECTGPYKLSFDTFGIDELDYEILGCDVVFDQDAGLQMVIRDFEEDETLRINSYNDRRSYAHRVEFPSYSTLEIHNADLKTYLDMYVHCMTGFEKYLVDNLTTGLNWKYGSPLQVDTNYTIGLNVGVVIDGKNIYYKPQEESLGVLSFSKQASEQLRSWDQPSILKIFSLESENYDYVYFSNYTHTIKYFVESHDDENSETLARPYLIFPIPLFSCDEYLYDNINFQLYFLDYAKNIETTYNQYGISYDSIILNNSAKTDIRLPYYHILPFDFVNAMLTDFLPEWYGPQPRMFSNVAIENYIQEILSEHFKMDSVTYREIENESISYNTLHPHLYLLYIGIPIYNVDGWVSKADTQSNTDDIDDK